MADDGIRNGQVTQDWRDRRGMGIVKAAILGGGTISTLTGLAAWYWSQISPGAQMQIIQWFKGL